MTWAGGGREPGWGAPPPPCCPPPPPPPLEPGGGALPPPPATCTIRDMATFAAFSQISSEKREESEKISRYMLHAGVVSGHAAHALHSTVLCSRAVRHCTRVERNGKTGCGTLNQGWTARPEHSTAVHHFYTLHLKSLCITLHLTLQCCASHFAML